MCYPIENGPDVEKNVWRKDVRPDIIHYSPVLTIAAAGIFYSSSGFRAESTRTV